MTDAGGVVPDLVPARMVNEATYCPRLFYLEWVQSQFEDSADTSTAASSTASSTLGVAGCRRMLRTSRWRGRCTSPRRSLA